MRETAVQHVEDHEALIENHLSTYKINSRQIRASLYKSVSRMKGCKVAFKIIIIRQVLVTTTAIKVKPIRLIDPVLIPYT